jgi:hypothetical protein
LDLVRTRLAAQVRCFYQFWIKLCKYILKWSGIKWIGLYMFSLTWNDSTQVSFLAEDYLPFLFIAIFNCSEVTDNLGCFL